MDIRIGSTGNIVTGSVLDASKTHLERAIKRYDPQLYLTWNPYKNRGYGVWELRRRPAKKIIVDSVVYEGNTYCAVDYVEQDLENHVWDLPVLGYDLLQRLKEGDQWEASRYDPDRLIRLSRHNQKMYEAEKAVKEAAKTKAREEMMYKLKQDKAILKDFQERILSGVNPAHLMRYWK